MPSLKERFPYVTTFAATNLRVFSPNQDDIYLAAASIEGLKPYVDSSINLDDNFDMLGVVFNAFVVNRVNRNDQVISTEDALAAVNYFKYKFIDIEHDRQKIIGMITDYGFSEFGSDKILTADEVAGKTEPFNVFLKGFVWKVVNPDFAAKLEACSDVTSDMYLGISASWEMAFKEFAVVKGGKNLNECTAVDVSSLDEVKGMLKHFGGSGVDKKGNRVFMQMVGSILPLGVGFTSNPAAEVVGVGVVTENVKNIEEGDPEIDDEEDDEDDEESEAAASLDQKNEKNISQVTNNTVSTITDNQKSLAMLITKIEDINDESLKTIVASDVTTFIQDELKKASEQWANEKVAKDKEIADAAQAAEESKTALEALQSEAESLRAQLEEVKSQMAIKAQEDLFQARMASLDEEFELADADRAVIGEQIKNLDEDGFAKWAADFSVLAAAKKKVAKCAATCPECKKEAGKCSCDDESKESKASDEEESKEDDSKEGEATDALENAEVKASENTIPNNQGEVKTPTLSDRFSKAFTKESVKVSVK